MKSKPSPGQVWHWIPDDSGCDRHYGPGIVLGIREGWDDDKTTFISFMFGERVLNVPIAMVERFMYLASKS